MTQLSNIKYERIIPILDRILIEVITLTGDNKEAEQTKLREIANKKILDQKIEDFEITKAMNNCGIVKSASVDAHWISTGDIVFFGKYAGSEILIESLPHIMIRESDVLFILK